MRAQVSLPLAEASHVGEARRRATVLARGLRFSEADLGRVALVVTEAGTNLVVHAGGGELLLRPLGADGAIGLEVLALDRGPGMARIDECLRDGYSTAGTAGTGLGAIARLSTVFDIHSAPGIGTAVVARLWSRARAGSPGSGAPVTGAVCLARPGE